MSKRCSKCIPSVFYRGNLALCGLPSLLSPRYFFNATTVPSMSIPEVSVLAASDARYAAGRLDGTNILHFPPNPTTGPLRSTFPVMTDLAGDGPPKLERHRPVVIDFPPYRLLQTRLTRRVVALNLYGLEARALKWIP